ncbi:phospholipase A2, membrane associated-like [Dromiciops gliroides]|uniref:phospholipase A2, membrane associated-like n=1 Tax=Dromiciops gliroides TaxID=33562 RepID=UPI001CC46E11|nr:phospholipase A2, membrane associated-like [Dromiciops gliroides]
MKTFLLLPVLIAYGLSQVQGSLKQLQEMIEKVTGKNALVSYGFYGCHCGLGGHGIPKDATDRCCAAHDCCYSKLVKNSCHPKMEKYDYNYHNDVITCGSGSKCQEQICSCDRTLTYCMLENLRTYNPKYQSFPNILCGGSKPQC